MIGRQFGKPLHPLNTQETIIAHDEKMGAKSKRIQIIATDKENVGNSQQLPSKSEMGKLEVVNVIVFPKTISNPQYVIPYKEEIIQRMLAREDQLFKKLIDPFMMNKHKDLSETHRLYVVDHIMKMCYQFRLRDECLFMAVELLDSHLSFKVVDMKTIELVAHTAIFVASKYEEIYPPSLDQIVSRTTIQKSEVLTQEAHMLNARNFDLLGNTSLQWLTILFAQIDPTQRNVELFDLAKYILEASLYRTMMYHHKPSELALGALIQSQKWLRLPDLRFDIQDDLQVREVIIRKIGMLFTQIINKPDLFINKRYSAKQKFQTYRDINPK